MNDIAVLEADPVVTARENAAIGLADASMSATLYELKAKRSEASKAGCRLVVESLDTGYEPEYVSCVTPVTPGVRG